MDLLLLLTAVALTLAVSDANIAGHQTPKYTTPKVMCGPDTVLINFECWTCVCLKSNRYAMCFQKPCDHHDKVGICPPSELKMDDHDLCEREAIPQCKTDNDCPGPEVCCFDYCKGSTCRFPKPDPRIPLEQQPHQLQQQQGLPPGHPGAAPGGINIDSHLGPDGLDINSAMHIPPPGAGLPGLPHPGAEGIHIPQVGLGDINIHNPAGGPDIHIPQPVHPGPQGLVHPTPPNVHIPGLPPLPPVGTGFGRRKRK